MCELFAMSGRYPANVSFSLEEFARRGGSSGPHKDGWGIAFYEQKDVRLIRDTDSAAHSPCVEFIRRYKVPSKLIISHVRMATIGAVSLMNTQPFHRELGGRMHVFAHNGDLTNIQARQDFPLGNYHPLGDTDSEFAFCHLLGQLQALWKPGVTPSLQHRYRQITAFAEKISPLGPANFLYSDGEYLFAHGHKRTQPGREGFHPPGLYWLCRSCFASALQVEIPGVKMEYGEKAQHVALVATVPLTSEKWIPLSEGEVLVLKDGKAVQP